MYRFSIIALAVASLALVAAGTAFAEAKVGGGITGGFGQITTTPAATGAKASSQLTTQSEAVLEMSGASGPVSAKARIELTEGHVTVDNTRHYVAWAITDAFKIQFNGSSFGSTAGSAPFGNSVVGHLTSFAGPGHMAGNTQWVVGGVNDSNTDLNFKIEGTGDVGMVIAGDFDLRNGNAAGKENLTTTPYFNGKFGDISVHVYLASASQKVTTGTTTDTNSSSETSLAGAYKADGLKVALQIATGKYGKDAAEISTSSTNLGVGVAGITFHFITNVEAPKTGDNKVDQTDIAVAYTAAIADGAEWSVGYGQLKDNRDQKKVGGTAGDASSQILFSVRGKF
jgi:hypothetical protein